MVAFMGRSAVSWSIAAASGVALAAAATHVYLRHEAKKIVEEDRIRVQRDNVRQVALRNIRDADARQDGNSTVYTELKNSVYSSSDGTARMWSDYLALQPNWKEYESEGVKMVSLRSYLRSLHVPGGVDFRKIAVTLFSNLHMGFVLPFLGHMPKVSQEDRATIDDFSMRVIQTLLQNLISPVTLSAISVTMHKTAQALVLDVKDPVEELHVGIAEKFRDPLGELPNPFNIQRDLNRLAARISTGEIVKDDASYDELKNINDEFLPGLYQGAPGIPIRESEMERAASRVLTAVFNRLTSNLVPYSEGDYDEYAFREKNPEREKVDHGGPFKHSSIDEDDKNDDIESDEDEIPSRDKKTEKPKPRMNHEKFFVEIELGGKLQRFDSPYDLLEALAKDPEHEVEIGIRSLLTSFGIAFCVRDTDEELYHIPLAVPMRTGLTGVNGKDIVVPMSHAGVPVVIRGPALQGEVATEWYQDVGSMTGWQPYVWRKWPWHLGAERWHTNCYVPEGEWTLDKQLELVRACCIVSVLSNVASRDTGLAQGGYGYVGVCLDSVAIAQAAVLGETTIFPLLLSGQARTDLLSVAHRMITNMRERDGADETMVKSTERVIGSILNLETDIDIPPRFVHAACQRLIQTLPDHSCFKLVYKATDEARKLQEFMQTSYHKKLDPPESKLEQTSDTEA